jgi:two-component sensor histidine kinase
VLLVALLVSEPVTNCLKHAFKDGSQGHIAINFQTISDDGCGATARLKAKVWAKPSSMASPPSKCRMKLTRA